VVVFISDNLIVFINFDYNENRLYRGLGVLALWKPKSSDCICIMISLLV